MQGITIRPLVEFLDVKKANKKQQAVSEEIHSRVGSGRANGPGEKEDVGSGTQCGARGSVPEEEGVGGKEEGGLRKA